MVKDNIVNVIAKIMEKFKKNKISPAEARLFLASVEGNRKFFATNGEEIANLYELFDSLNRMEHSDFQHHVNEQRNDFSLWIEDCITDKGLAEKVKTIKDKDEMTLHVGNQVRAYLMTLRNE